MIALEGCNGSGKTTICKMLTSHYGLPYMAGVPLCMHVNHELREKMFSSSHFESAFLYYLSGVLIQKEFIRDINSKFVIIDRSILSTLAYHYSIGKKARLDHIINFLLLLEDKPIFPDLTIWIDAPFEISKSRIGMRNSNDVTDIQMSDSAISKKESEFYYMIHDEFINFAQASIIRCDISSLTSEQTFECVVATIDKKLYERGLVDAADDE